MAESMPAAGFNLAWAWLLLLLPLPWLLRRWMSAASRAGVQALRVPWFGQVVDAAEYQLPAGRYPITDGEQAAILDTGGRDSGHRYRSMSLEHLNGPRRMFQKHQCGWLTLHTDDDPVDVLGRELRVLVGRPK